MVFIVNIAYLATSLFSASASVSGYAPGMVTISLHGHCMHGHYIWSVVVQFV